MIAPLSLRCELYVVHLCSHHANVVELAVRSFVVKDYAIFLSVRCREDVDLPILMDSDL